MTRWLRESFPGVPLLAGGVQATYDCEELLAQDHCDVLFRREAELQFKAFLEGCKGPAPAPLPLGIAFRHGGRVYELGQPEGDVPVEWDIRPCYDLIDVEGYNRVGSLAAFSRFNGADKPFATVLGNRGCRAHCTFCTVRDFNGKGVRGRPPRASSTRSSSWSATRASARSTGLTMTCCGTRPAPWPCSRGWPSRCPSWSGSATTT